MNRELKEVIKKLAKRGIKVKRIGITLEGREAYRVVGQGFHPEALWAKSDIVFADRYGKFDSSK